MLCWGCPACSQLSLAMLPAASSPAARYSSESLLKLWLMHCDPAIGLLGSSLSQVLSWRRVLNSLKTIKLTWRSRKPSCLLTWPPGWRPSQLCPSSLRWHRSSASCCLIMPQRALTHTMQVHILARPYMHPLPLQQVMTPDLPQIGSEAPCLSRRCLAYSRRLSPILAGGGRAGSQLGQAHHRLCWRAEQLGVQLWDRMMARALESGVTRAAAGHRPGSPAHRARVRTWQALCALSPFLTAQRASAAFGAIWRCIEVGIGPTWALQCGSLEFLPGTSCEKLVCSSGDFHRCCCCVYLSRRLVLVCNIGFNACRLATWPPSDSIRRPSLSISCCGIPGF